MSRKDPRSVFTSDDHAAAEFVAEWLGKQGIDSELITHIKESDGVGLTPFSDSQSTSHMEVFVKNIDDVETVKKLIVENQESILQEAKKRDETTPEKIAVVCDHCGKTAVYPGTMQGTVQECPYCGEYLDVPGGEDEFDWSVVDETISEDELADQDSDEESDAWG